MGERAPFRVLFVCLGNICRSPTAEGTMRALVREAGLDTQIELDSAGTGSWHAGSAPDERATAAAARRGITLQGAARRVRDEDFEQIFTYETAQFTGIAHQFAIDALADAVEDFIGGGDADIGQPLVYHELAGEDADRAGERCRFGAPLGSVDKTGECAQLGVPAGEVTGVHLSNPAMRRAKASTNPSTSSSGTTRLT